MGQAAGLGLLRPVEPADVAIFYDQQDDAEAAAMAAFPVRDRDTLEAHWTRILADPTVIARTVLDDGMVAGNLVSFVAEGRREIGYWLGRAFWGHGLATRALAEFLGLIEVRPLFARVAEHNTGSRKVLSRNGFREVRRHRLADDDVVEVEFRLDAC
jgi:RimJ/RimL family protein N-acetyltransferase